ncbi:MAG: C69 family dipeptidase [Bacteroidales bacterium]
MKRISILILCLVFLVSACAHPSSQSNMHSSKNQEDTIRCAVLDVNGGSQTCVMETVAALKIDSDIVVSQISSSDIADGILDNMDVIVIPGGGGSRQYLNLGKVNRDKIKEFVKNGGGAVGICAGAYLFSNTPGYACLYMNGAKAIDIEHDGRGHGISAFKLTIEGKKIFPELANRNVSYMMYYEGPLFVKSNSNIKYSVLSTLLSDVHIQSNAPKGMTVGKPCFISNQYGKGRIFSFVSHPEATPGMQWMVPRAIRWTINKTSDKIYKTYSSEVINPNIFNKEILMTSARLKKESSYYDVLLYGNDKEKVDALKWLESVCSWDAKRWVQGLIFDEYPEVRAQAADFIKNLGYRYYLKDLKIANSIEKNSIVKSKLEKAINELSITEVKDTAKNDFDGMNCYTIIVGKDVSSTGKVIVAHNEDDWNESIVDFHYLNATDVHTDMASAEVADANLLWIEVTNENYADGFINQYGVSICSNCTSSRFKDLQGDLTYSFRRYIAKYAKSSRDAVRMASYLMKEFGYKDRGRTYTFADDHEAWLFQTIQGDNWLASRVPNDKVVIIPNYYVTKNVNFKDTANFKASPNLKVLAINNGLYKEGDVFNFREIFSAPKDLTSLSNIARKWAGLNMLSNKQYGMYDDFPFAITPKKKINKEILYKVLGHRYSNITKEKYFNGKKVMNIYSDHNQYSIVFEYVSSKKPIAKGLSHNGLKELKNPFVPCNVWISVYGPNKMPFTLLYKNDGIFDSKWEKFKINEENGKSL